MKHKSISLFFFLLGTSFLYSSEEDKAEKPSVSFRELQLSALLQASKMVHEAYRVKLDCKTICEVTERAGKVPEELSEYMFDTVQADARFLCALLQIPHPESEADFTTSVPDLEDGRIARVNVLQGACKRRPATPRSEKYVREYYEEINKSVQAIIAANEALAKIGKKLY